MTVRHVSLLRGINVGGHNLISMARLRALYEAFGCEDVATYLQSGNVVFHRDREPAGVDRAVERAIKRELGIDVRVLERSHRDTAGIVEADPFPLLELSGDRGLRPALPHHAGSAGGPVSISVVGALWTAGIEPSRPAW